VAPSSRSRPRMAEACGHRSYVLLGLGVLTCGFSGLHHRASAAYLSESRCPRRKTGGWVIAAIGLFNIHRFARVGWLQKGSKTLYPVGDLLTRAISDRRFISSRSRRFSAIMSAAVSGRPA